MEQFKNEHLTHEFIGFHFKRFSNSLRQFPNSYATVFPGVDLSDGKHIVYLCPLCLEKGCIATPEIPILWSSEFSKDHYPPENVGGTAQLLICRDCNNRAGGEFENELTKQMNIRAYNKKVPDAKIKVRSKISAIKGNYNSELNAMPDGRMAISLKPNEKANIKLLDEWIERSKTDPDYSVEVTVTDANEEKITRAMLKAAYLYCFETWGYDFVFSYSGKQIRKIIKGEGSYPLKMPSFWLTDIIKKGSLQSGVYFLSRPIPYRSLMVIMELTESTTGYQDTIAVLIPGPDEADWNDLYRLQTELDKEENTDITMNKVIRDVLDNGILDGYHKSSALLSSGELSN